VGFNIRGSDLPIILQRALVHGLAAPGFCARPAKPWEGVDYFVRNGDWVVDLKDLWGGYGKATPSLNELAAAAGIPGKIELSGDRVADLWAAGEVDRIVEYNEFDALTTYLVWLRTAHLAGHLDDGQFRAEEAQLRDLLTQLTEAERPYLAAFLQRWDVLAREHTAAEPPDEVV
jgi:predicted PolB exonuclease-like 3'-5' exonuclease